MAAIGALASGPVLTAGAVLSELDSAFGAKNAAESQADQADINARQIALSTELELEREARRGRARIGAAEARVGASGTTRTGSALSLISDEVFEDVLNQAIISSQGGQAVTRQQNLATTARARGRAALTSGSIRAVTSGLNVASNFGSIL